MLSNLRENISNMRTRGISKWTLIACLVFLAVQTGSAAETRVVCYYTNWSVYRPGTAKFNPQNINPYLCTHLIYAFGGFTKENTLKPFDKYQDIEKGGYAKFTGLKTYNPNLKTMIAIGGWNEGSSRFSSLVASSERRRELVKNAIKFLRQNKFDGLDLDWEYPAFRDGGKPKDRANYARLVQELREEFEKESAATGRSRLLLTMAVPAGIEYINKGYDVPKLNRYLDWMNILSYDYHSAFEPAVDHHSPLYALEAPSEYNYDTELNIDFTIKHYLEAGADRDKLVLGIPTYGRTFTLFNPDSTAIGSPADGPGEQGDATREKGYLAYYEICESLLPKTRSKRASDDDDDDEDSYDEEAEEWTVVQPNPSAMGPYAYRGNQWVGYDDIDIVKKKAEYVAENGLGGIMFWSIDNDDFRGKCHGKPYPLIEAAKSALYKSLGLTEKITPPKKAQPTRKRPKPSKPSKDTEEDISKNTIRNTRKRTQAPVEEPTTESSSRRRQNLKRGSTTTESSVQPATPEWGLNTPEPPTTPDPGTDFKCEEEGFFPHPRDCKKYFWCLESGPSNLGIVAHQFTCPSGLYFNKNADSCDFARNVLCNKKKAAVTSAPPASTTTATTAAPSTTTPGTRSTTAASRLSSQLSNLFTSRRPPVKITAATSSTTLSRFTTTTEITPEEEYEEDVVEDVDGSKESPDAEEDPKVIKELIDLIKKLGGVEQLEKYLDASGSNQGTQGSRITTPPTVSRLLYERVLSQARPLGERAPPQINSRGPQAAGLEKFRETEVKTSSRWERPQYTTINRQRPQRPSSEEAVVASEESAEFEEEDVSEAPSSTHRASIPQYVNIRRGRPTTTEQPDPTVINALFDREPENIVSDVDDVKNGVQSFEYATVKRFRPETQETTTSRYKTIQRVRTTTPETFSKSNEGSTEPVTENPTEIPQKEFIPSTDNPIQTSPKYATVARFPTTLPPEVIESDIKLTNNLTDSNDINVEIASPSFASENGVIKTVDSSSILNAQITTFSNIPKYKENESTPTSITYSTEVTISEDPYSSTQRIPQLFAKRTRPTTTKSPENSEQTTSANKVSFDRKYANIKRTRISASTNTTTPDFKARLTNEIVSEVEKGIVGEDISRDNVLGETNNTVSKDRFKKRRRLIRSTTPSSEENQNDNKTEVVANYGNKRFSRPQSQFNTRRATIQSNTQLKNSENSFNITNENNRLVGNRSSIIKELSPRRTFKSRTLQNTSREVALDAAVSESETETISRRPQPRRQYRPTFNSFDSDLSSLTALDNARNRKDGEEVSTGIRNTQVNRRFRPSFASTKPPIADSVDSDSSITPVISNRQRKLVLRGGRFTTPSISEEELNAEASESSVVVSGRKVNVSRFTPRPFSRISDNIYDLEDAIDTELAEENELNTDIQHESKLIGTARLTAPAIQVQEDVSAKATSPVPLSEINVTKVINSNILLGQTNNKSGILLLRRPSRPVNGESNDSKNTEENLEKIHLSESNIEESEHENVDDIISTVSDRPRKRIIVKKLRPTTSVDSPVTESTLSEITESEKDNGEPVLSDNKDLRPRVRKVLKRRPATSTTTSLPEISPENIQNQNVLLSNARLQTNQTNPIQRKRKIVRKKLKPVVTEEGKVRILQTQNENVVDDENEISNITTEKPTELITDVPISNEDIVTVTETVDNELNDLNTSPLSTTKARFDRPSYRPVKRPLSLSTTTEASTTAKVYSRKYNVGSFTTPSSPIDRDQGLVSERVRIDIPRKPVFSARPFSRRPSSTARTTTTDEEDEYDNEEDNANEKEEEEENKLVFVPLDQLFTRAPLSKPTDIETINSDDKNDDELDSQEYESEEEDEEIRTTPSTRPPNRFAAGQRPTLPSRSGLSSGRESNRPINRPIGFKPSTDDSNKRFNRPVAFQPNKLNRFGGPTSSTPTETTTKQYARKYTPTKPLSESTVVEESNKEVINAKHKQLFSNPKRYTTIAPSSLKETVTEQDEIFTTEIYPETTVDILETTDMETESDVWLSITENSTDEMSTVNEGLTQSVSGTEISNNAQETTMYPESQNVTEKQLETTTPNNIEISTEIISENKELVKTSTQLDRLFAVSRIVEVSSKQDKHRLNSKNESRLIEEGEIKQEKKPTLDKIGEVSRFTLIKIVEGDIPIYLTNLSHEYPVENPPFNPIRIDEARNARNLNSFSDSGKENLIASESVNAAYNHKHGYANFVESFVDIDDSKDIMTSKSNKVYIVESSTVIEEAETESTLIPTTMESSTEYKFVPGAIDIELVNKKIDVITPKSSESSTISLESLFNYDANSTTEKQDKVNVVTGSQPFVVYAAPPSIFSDENNTFNSENSSRISNSRSITNIVQIQVLKPDEEVNLKSMKGSEFKGVPAAVDVITEKQQTTKSPIMITILTKDTDSTQSTTPKTSEINKVTTKNIDVLNKTEMINTSTQMPETEPSSEPSSSVPSTSSVTSIVGINDTTVISESTSTIDTATETTTVEVTTVTTEEPKQHNITSVKIQPISLSANDTLSKLAKNRSKLPFRRYQGIQKNLTNTTKVSISSYSKPNIKNRSFNISTDIKNVPHIPPKYNRTNSYTSGRSRFSAVRTQNVPVDARKKIETNRFKPNSTTEAPPKTLSANTESVKRVTIRPFRPNLRLSPFLARRTTTEATTQISIETTTVEGITEIPSSDNTINPGYSDNAKKTSDAPNVKPTFFPRRSSNRYSNNLKSEQQQRRSTTTTTTTEASSTQTNRFSALGNLRKRPTYERRRPSLQQADSNATDAEATTSIASTRPTRVFVRKYYNQRSGAGNINNSTTQRSAQSTIRQTLDGNSRRVYRVGLRRRTTTTTSTTTSPPIPDETSVIAEESTTKPPTETDSSIHDQEFHSTIHQIDGKPLPSISHKKIKIQKRPLSNGFKDNQFSSEVSKDPTNEEHKAEEEKTNKKKYSSVIKQDNTLVQKEVSEETLEDVNLDNIGGDVTAAVAVAAHQLLSAPLPTSPSYEVNEDHGSFSTSNGEVTFTRAYLMASTLPPIISPADFIASTEYPSTSSSFQYSTKGRRISTTVAPHFSYSPSSSPRPAVVRKRKPRPPATFEKIAPVVRHYRPVIDYEYYDDDDVRIVEKTRVQNKVIIRGSGVIQCLDQGNFPHPESCKKFISCAKMENGGVYGWAYTCPKGLSFDPVGGLCNWSAGLGCKEH